MSVRVKVRISKIMHTSVKVGVRAYATYANCQALLNDILYVNKCKCIGLSVVIAQFHLYFLSSQTSHSNIAFAWNT